MSQDESSLPLVRMNAHMGALKAPLPDAPHSREFDARLVAVLDAGFEEIAGCVVLSRFAESARRTSVAECWDETGFEAFVNHVHIEDEVPGATGPEALRQAVPFAGCLAGELVRAYPGEAFEIVVTLSDSCTVRFHKLRAGQSWLADDIESYDEAIMCLSVPGRR